MKQHLRWVLLSGLLAGGLASALTWLGLSGWHWRVAATPNLGAVIRLFLWFTWPALPLAVLTVWSWRRQALRRHIAVPLLSAMIGFGACLAMGGQDRALLHALPPLAVLAAFALPAIKRGLSAAIDWFSVFFFTGTALLIWVVYGAMYTGWPHSTANNVAKLVPGYAKAFSWPLLLTAAGATLAWLALVRWRTARHQSALWKSVVLPAGGVALGWLLLMTLWLPLMDQSRSYRLLMERIKPHVRAGSCISAPGASAGLLTALEYFGHYTVDGRSSAKSNSCEVLMLSVGGKQRTPTVPGWHLVARERQRTQNSESVAIYRKDH